MASLNKVTLIGNIGKVPEFRATANGKEIASFSLACGERWKDKASGEYKEKTEWVNIVIFNEQLVNIIKLYAKKGNKLYVEGALQTRKWTDKDGVDRYVTEVVLQAFNGKIVLLDGKIDNEPSSHEQSKKNGYVDEIDIDDQDIPF